MTRFARLAAIVGLAIVVPVVRSVRLQADRGRPAGAGHDLAVKPVLITLLLVLSCPAVGRADVGLLRTVQVLDDVRGYCLDIGGAGATLRLDDRLQVHTCRYGGPLDDQRFERAPNGAIRATMYNCCLAAAALEPGAGLLLRACGDSPAQRWSMAWGRISPESRPDLCVSVAGEKGQPAGTPILISPVYHRRDVSLERCADARQAVQSFRWSLHDERALSTAEIARSGMPPDVAKQLASLGSVGGANAETYKIYASQPRVHEAAEIKMHQEPGIRTARATATRHPYSDAASRGAPRADCRGVSRWRTGRREPREYHHGGRLLREHRARGGQRRISTGA